MAFGSKSLVQASAGLGKPAKHDPGGEADAILGVLNLVDLELTGSLLPIVILSGYENFVSKIDHSTPTKPSVAAYRRPRRCWRSEGWRRRLRADR